MAKESLLGYSGQSTGPADPAQTGRGGGAVFIPGVALLLGLGVLLSFLPGGTNVLPNVLLGFAGTFIFLSIVALIGGHFDLRRVINAAVGLGLFQFVLAFATLFLVLSGGLVGLGLAGILTILASIAALIKALDYIGFSPVTSLLIVLILAAGAFLVGLAV